MTSSPGTPQHRVVVAERIRHYPERKADPRHGIIVHRPISYTDEKGKRKLHFPSDPGGVGRETVREAKVCPTCAGKIGGR